MNSILQKINDHKKEEIALLKKRTSINDFDLNSSPLRDFIGGLQKRRPAIIAEIKKASPSKGLIREDFDVKAIARTYEQYGASCLSVLTDVDFFKGAPSYLLEAKNEISLPVLRKDFIIDSYQIYESRALGADCILLIVALLDDKKLEDFCKIAQELNMAVLVESHTKEEFLRAIKLPTPLIGVNNRSLHNFKTDKNISFDLVKELPQDKIFITESGINSKEDIVLMQEKGINTFLIGESLMRENNIGKKLQEFME